MEVAYARRDLVRANLPFLVLPIVFVSNGCYRFYRPDRLDRRNRLDRLNGFDGGDRLYSGRLLPEMPSHTRIASCVSGKSATFYSELAFRGARNNKPRTRFPEEHKPLLGGSLAKCRRDAQSMRRKKSSGWWYNLASSSTSTKSNRLSPDSAFATNDYGRRKCPAKSDCVSPASMRVYSCRRNGVFGTPARLSAAANGKGSVTGPSSIAQLASR